MNPPNLKRAAFFSFLLGLCLLIGNGLSIASDKTVHLIRLDDSAINPATASYIQKSIANAEKDGAECLILQLDTPGGLLNSTRTIVKDILASRVPVVVYVAPGGARAGSAGVFITYSAHVAAMAPSTNIGAAHPVQMGREQSKRSWWEELQEGLQKGEEEASQESEEGDEGRTQEAEQPIDAPAGASDEDPMSSKILQDTVAFIKTLAQQRGRNVEWAVRSVTESSSITEEEALSKGVVEIVASNTEDLLRQLDGRTVEVAGEERILNTKDAVVRAIEMDFRERFLNILANPNIAYIFMILGFYGLLYEVTHPGFGVPGVLGLILLILAFFSMQTLPTNYAGLALIILSLVLFVAEAYVPGLGLLTLGGAICMVLGSIMLFESSVPMMRVSFSLVLAVTLTTAGITVFLVRSVIQAHRAKVHGGKEGLIGEIGTAETGLHPGREGKVFVHGELWNAVADEKISKGEKVAVESIEHMTLKVKKV